jgi:Lecithin retinol acyltransferase
VRFAMSHEMHTAGDRSVALAGAQRIANQDGTSGERLFDSRWDNVLPIDPLLTVLFLREGSVERSGTNMFLDQQWEGNDDAQTTESKCQQCDGRRRHRRLHEINWLLAPGREPPVGAHMVALRRGYTHHGIYIGAGMVVHYAGLARGLRRGPVEEISITGFAAGYPVGVASGAPPIFASWEVVRRARSRLGEDCYRLLTQQL